MSEYNKPPLYHVRTCKGCQREFHAKVHVGRPYQYCPICRPAVRHLVDLLREAKHRERRAKPRLRRCEQCTMQFEQPRAGRPWKYCYLCRPISEEVIIAYPNQ